MQQIPRWASKDPLFGRGCSVSVVLLTRTRSLVLLPAMVVLTPMNQGRASTRAQACRRTWPPDRGWTPDSSRRRQSLSPCAAAQLHPPSSFPHQAASPRNTKVHVTETSRCTPPIMSSVGKTLWYLWHATPQALRASRWAYLNVFGAAYAATELESAFRQKGGGGVLGELLHLIPGDGAVLAHRRKNPAWPMQMPEEGGVARCLGEKYCDGWSWLQLEQWR